MFTQLRETLATILHQVGKALALSLVLFFSAPAWILSTARAEVIITEILANPETGTEWIELAILGEETVDISNFTLYDTVSSPSLLLAFPDPTLLLPNTAHVFEISGSKLNNTGDALVLKDVTLTTVLEQSFGPSTKGLSWQRSLATSEYAEFPPTPGVLIVASTPSPTPEPSPSPTPYPQPSPTVVPNATNNPNQMQKTPSLTEVSKEQVALESEITSLLQTFKLSSFTFYNSTTSMELPDASKAAKTMLVKKPFSPPNLSGLSVMCGGILICSASYLQLYVSEQSTESQQFS